MTETDSPLRVVLVRPKVSANVGAAARALKNFGLHELVLVAPRCAIDGQARALASHAEDVLERARIVPTLDEALAGVVWAVGTTPPPRASEATPEYEPDAGLRTLPERGGALVFGAEDHGLSNDELDRCQALVRIPTAEYASVNLAQAVNVLAHRHFELRRAGVPAAPAAELASRDQVERMYGDLVDLWHLIGFTDAKREAATLRLFRGIFDRARLGPREVAALRGLWSQARWAARLPPEALPGRREGDGGASR